MQNRAFYQLLKEQVSIVDFIKNKIPLTKKNNLWFGCCPFHGEKTPSFSVNPAKRSYYCFGCQEHGDIFSFVMKTDGLPFADALKFVANYFGITMPTPQNMKLYSLQKKMIQDSAQFYHQNLYKCDMACDFLKSRGVSDDSISAFYLGLSKPSTNCLMNFLQKQGYRENMAYELSLITYRENRAFEFFADRLIFPIHDAVGDVVAFGGRILNANTSEGPKYINARDHILFHKSKIFYGLHQAKNILNPKHPAYLIVEGYLDVILCWQFNYRSVAAMGTALNHERIIALWEQTDQPYLMMDGDTAGKRATDKIARKLLPHLKPGKSFSICILPDAHDPASLLNTDPVNFDAAVEKAYALHKWIYEKNRDTAYQEGPHNMKEFLEASPETQSLFFNKLFTDIDTIVDMDIRQNYRQFIKNQWYQEKKKYQQENYNKGAQKKSLFLQKNTITPALAPTKLTKSWQMLFLLLCYHGAELGFDTEYLSQIPTPLNHDLNMIWAELMDTDNYTSFIQKNKNTYPFLQKEYWVQNIESWREIWEYWITQYYTALNHEKTDESYDDLLQRVKKNI